MHKSLLKWIFTQFIVCTFTLSGNVVFGQDTSVPGEPGAVKRPFVPYHGKAHTVQAGPVNVDVSQIDVTAFPIINVFVRVTDQNGELIDSLTKANFALTEDGVPEQIDSVEERGGQEQLSVVLVIDVSGSMGYSGGEGIEAAKEAAKMFVDSMALTDQACIVSFADEAVLCQPWTRNKDSLKTAIDRLYAEGSTSMYDGVYLGLEQLSGVTGVKALIVLADGDDNDSWHTNTHVIDYAKSLGVPIYSIGLGSELDPTRLMELSDNTGGYYKEAPTPEDLKQLYLAISQSIRNQYRITYATHNTIKDERDRTVIVTATTVAGSGSGTGTYRSPFVKLWVDIVGRDQIREGRWANYYIEYENVGNVTMNSPYLILQTSQDSLLRPDPQAKPAPGIAFPALSRKWPWDVLPPGERRQIMVQVKGGIGVDSVDLLLTVSASAGEFGPSSQAGGVFGSPTRGRHVSVKSFAQPSDINECTPSEGGPFPVYLTIDDVTNHKTLDLISVAQDFKAGVKVACFANMVDESPEAWLSLVLLGRVGIPPMKNPIDGLSFHPQIVREIIDGGHEIGYHGFTHSTSILGRLPPDMAWIDFGLWLQAMDAIDPRWRPLDGQILVRFPGWYASQEIQNKFSAFKLVGGYTIGDWRLRASDMLSGFQRQETLDGIVAAAVEQASNHRAQRPTEPFVLVVHQDYVTPNDLRTVLQGLSENGFELADFDKTCVTGYPHYGQGSVSPNEYVGVTKRLTIVTSIDPNDKAGPQGFSTEHFIPSMDQQLLYVIYFENVDTATAPAEDIQITDYLDQNLDWTWFEFGETSHPATTSFSPTTGKITWTFYNINLPPNVNPPEGEGWVSFTIKPKKDLPSGTKIKNKATIDFELYYPPPPMETREVFNTIDALPPNSSIEALAETQPLSNFEVRWSGADDDSGSGIKDYSIYVSDNGGIYTLWLTTDSTSAIFTGRNGHTYRFFSLARDNVGNTELSPTEPDAVTTINLVEALAVSPNPFVPTRGHTQITFFGAGLPLAKIKIYNKAGELVQTLKEREGRDRLDWNAKSSDGKDLASGVYIWVLIQPSGHKEKGKFAIIR